MHYYIYKRICNYSKNIDVSHEFSHYPVPKISVRIFLREFIRWNIQLFREFYLSLIIFFRVHINIALLQKVIEWLYQIINEVEFIVIHVLRYDQCAWASALKVQVLTVFM